MHFPVRIVFLAFHFFSNKQFFVLDVIFRQMTETFLFCFHADDLIGAKVSACASASICASLIYVRTDFVL